MRKVVSLRTIAIHMTRIEALREMVGHLTIAIQDKIKVELCVVIEVLGITMVIQKLIIIVIQFKEISALPIQNLALFIVGP